MPSTVSTLAASADLELGAPVPWGELPPCDSPGVYLIALDHDARSTGHAVQHCPIDLGEISALLSVREELTVDGVRANAAQLGAVTGVAERTSRSSSCRHVSRRRRAVSCAASVASWRALERHGTSGEVRRRPESSASGTVRSSECMSARRRSRDGEHAGSCHRLHEEPKGVDPPALGLATAAVRPTPGQRRRRGRRRMTGTPMTPRTSRTMSTMRSSSMPGACPAVSALKPQRGDACLEASATTSTKRAEHSIPSRTS